MTNLESIRSEILTGRGKFEADEMTPDHINAAAQYTHKYIADGGTFEFVLEMASQLAKKGTLSPGQAKGVLNVFRAEVNREVESAKAKLVQIADGVYEIGTWKFQLATQADDAEFAAGETIISYPGKRKPWLGAGFVRGTKIQFWTRIREDYSLASMRTIAELLVAGGSTNAVAERQVA